MCTETLSFVRFGITLFSAPEGSHRKPIQIKCILFSRSTKMFKEELLYVVSLLGLVHICMFYGRFFRIFQKGSFTAITMQYDNVLPVKYP